MKVEIKKSKNLRRELAIEVPKDRVSQTLSEVYREIAKVAKIKGFRKGKAPRHVLEKSHGHMAQEEMVKKLVPEAYDEGVKQTELDPIDLPEISDVKFKDGELHFTAKLDVKPEIKLKKYKELKVKRKSSEVTDKEVEKTFEFFKKGQGEDKDKEVKIDDEFARKMGFPNLEEFKTSLKRQMEMDKERQNRMDVEEQVIDQVLKNAKLDVPETLVNKQMYYRLEEMKKHWKSHGMSDADIEKKAEEASKDLKEASEKDVKVYLTFQEIAKLESVEVKQGESLIPKVLEFLLKEAKWEETK